MPGGGRVLGVWTKAVADGKGSYVWEIVFGRVGEDAGLLEEGDAKGPYPFPASCLRKEPGRAGQKGRVSRSLMPKKP